MTEYAKVFWERYEELGNHESIISECSVVYIVSLMFCYKKCFRGENSLEWLVVSH